LLQICSSIFLLARRDASASAKSFMLVIGRLGRAGEEPGRLLHMRRGCTNQMLAASGDAARRQHIQREAADRLIPRRGGGQRDVTRYLGGTGFRGAEAEPQLTTAERLGGGVEGGVVREDGVGDEGHRLLLSPQPPLFGDAFYLPKKEHAFRLTATADRKKMIYVQKRCAKKHKVPVLKKETLELMPWIIAVYNRIMTFEEFTFIH
jgi:hypothetical protein